MTIWGTQDEIKFVEKLGQWSKCNVPWRELVKRYLESLEKRVKWEGIDKEKVRRKALERLEKGGEESENE